MMMKLSGVDGAQDLVLQFMDMIDARGQYDLLAGAKASYDADAVLVPTGGEPSNPLWSLATRKRGPAKVFSLGHKKLLRFTHW